MTNPEPRDFQAKLVFQNFAIRLIVKIVFKYAILSYADERLVLQPKHFVATG